MVKLQKKSFDEAYSNGIFIFLIINAACQAASVWEGTQSKYVKITH